MNELVTNSLTALERELQIDSEGMVSAKHLYDFLGLADSQYARWCKINILENPVLTENVDFKPFRHDVENPNGGRPTQDYKISISLAKELCILAKTETGKRAREFFAACEVGMKIMLPEIQKRDLYIQELKQEFIQFQNKIENITEQHENRLRSLEGLEKLETRWHKSVFDRINSWIEKENPKLPLLRNANFVIEQIIEKTHLDLNVYTRDYMNQTGDCLPDKLAVIESYEVLKRGFDIALNSFIEENSKC